MLDIKHYCQGKHQVGNVDEYSLQLGELPELVTMELRIGQILAERAFMEVSHTYVKRRRIDVSLVHLLVVSPR